MFDLFPLENEKKVGRNEKHFNYWSTSNAS